MGMGVRQAASEVQTSCEEFVLSTVSRAALNER